MILLCLFGCKRSTMNKSIEEVQLKSNISDLLVGKSIQSIGSIINDERENNYVILVFSFYDCETCVDAGFHIIKKIDSLSGERICYPVATMLNPSSYQQRNEYFVYIYG